MLDGRIVVLRTDVLDKTEIGHLRPWRTLSSITDRQYALNPPQPGLFGLTGAVTGAAKVVKTTVEVVESIRRPRLLLGLFGALVLIGGAIAVVVAIANGQ